MHISLRWLTLVTALIVLVCGNLGTYSHAADEEYILGNVNTLAADFSLSIQITTQDGSVYSDKPALVHKVCTFKLDREGTSGSIEDQVYDISLFRDGQFLKTFKDTSLPFTLKRNFRGLRNGEYTFTFVARDQNAVTGKGQIAVTVQH